MDTAGGEGPGILELTRERRFSPSPARVTGPLSSPPEPPPGLGSRDLSIWASSPRGSAVEWAVRWQGGRGPASLSGRVDTQHPPTAGGLFTPGGFQSQEWGIALDPRASLTKGRSKCPTCALPWPPLVDWLWGLGLWTQGSGGSLGGEGVEGFRGGQGLVSAQEAGQSEKGRKERLLGTSIYARD